MAAFAIRIGVPLQVLSANQGSFSLSGQVTGLTYQTVSGGAVLPSSPTIRGAIPVGGSGQFTISWNEPLTNADSSVIGTITTCTVYYTQTAGQAFAGGTGTLSQLVATGVKTLNKTGVSPTGAWYVAVTATTASGESLPCPEQPVTVT